MWHMKDNGQGYLFCKMVFIDLSSCYTLWVRWLLVGACSAAHPSLGTEPQSNLSSMAFLRPMKQLHNSAHDCGIQHNIFWPNNSSNFPSFSSVANQFLAISSNFHWFLASWTIYSPYTAFCNNFYPFPSLLRNSYTNQ